MGTSQHRLGWGSANCFTNTKFGLNAFLVDRFTVCRSSASLQCWFSPDTNTTQRDTNWEPGSAVFSLSLETSAEALSPSGDTGSNSPPPVDSANPFRYTRFPIFTTASWARTMAGSRSIHKPSPELCASLPWPGWEIVLFCGKGRMTAFLIS